MSDVDIIADLFSFLYRIDTIEGHWIDTTRNGGIRIEYWSDNNSIIVKEKNE